MKGANSGAIRKELFEKIKVIVDFKNMIYSLNCAFLIKRYDKFMKANWKKLFFSK